jgi:GNAT superfamily N-acetyltransferase
MKVGASTDNQSAPEMVTLRDGSSVTVRPVGQDDEASLQTFLTGLCANSLRQRFFTGGANVADAAHWAACRPADRYGLLAHDQAGVLVAHAVYVQLDQTRAEVAVEVADHLHGRGLGTILMQRIGAVAQERGITHFVAEVLPENRAMLDVFRDGFDAHVALHEGIDTVEFPTSTWRLARERFGSESLQATGRLQDHHEKQANARPVYSGTITQSVS